MGNIQAKNEVDSSIAAAVSILSSTLQKCETALSQTEKLKIKGCKYVDIEGVTLDEIGEIDVQCAQDASKQTDVSNQVDSQIQQMAKAVEQAIGANPKSANATNIDNESVNLST